MRCGVSTACFYPHSTLESVKRAIQTGAEVIEIFLNTFSEMNDSYLARMLDEVSASGVSVGAVHPFTSPMEGLLFASRYDGRLQDGITMYSRYFEVCRILGADKLVFHGDNKSNGAFPMEQYAENLRQLAKAGQQYGVTLCHENVAYCRLHSSLAAQAYRNAMGGDAAFVLDVKQAIRGGAALPEMLRAMGAGLRHVHISDSSAEGDCLLPGAGGQDIGGFIRQLAQQGFSGDIVIEVYEDGYKTDADIAAALQHINKLLAACE